MNNYPAVSTIFYKFSSHITKFFLILKCRTIFFQMPSLLHKHNVACHFSGTILDYFSIIFQFFIITSIAFFCLFVFFLLKETSRISIGSFSVGSSYAESFSNPSSSTSAVIYIHRIIRFFINQKFRSVKISMTDSFFSVSNFSTHWGIPKLRQ